MVLVHPDKPRLQITVDHVGRNCLRIAFCTYHLHERASPKSDLLLLLPDKKRPQGLAFLS
jgi:hypothetical protein